VNIDLLISVFIQIPTVLTKQVSQIYQVLRHDNSDTNCCDMAPTMGL